jgi:bifunctional non-homologous end joining protein LigD
MLPPCRRRGGRINMPGRRSEQQRKRALAASPRPPAAAPRLTHPQRQLFSDPPISKQQLAGFYTAIADFILPGLVRRPLMLLRCPQGSSGECFFQKHVARGLPPGLRECEDPAARQRWIYIEGLEGLMALVQMNSVELHAWGCTVRDLQRADRLVIDLDPGEGVPWPQVRQAAVEVRERLAARRLRSFVRTTGGKGLHVVLPLSPPASWDAATSFARSLAEAMAREQPQRYLAAASKEKRAGRIFLDYLRNARGATAVCSYSFRRRAGAPVATPLAWEELAQLRGPDQFRFANIRRRLARLSADPWAGIGSVRQSLPPP